VLDGKVWERRKGQPYNSSKGLRPVGCLEAARSQVRAKGSRSTQESWSSKDNLVSCLIRPLACSTLPEDWVWGVESPCDGQVFTD
jgi:hypothetical protein